MADRALYGGTDTSFLLGTGEKFYMVYDEPGGDQVTDLLAAIVVGNDFTPGDPQDVVLGDDQRFYAFYGPPGRTAPLWAPKGYIVTALDGSGAPVYGPNWSDGAMRIFPDPEYVFAPADAVTDAQEQAIQGAVQTAFASGLGPGATQAVADALAASGTLNAAAAPTIAANRVPDPQAKTSGGSTSTAGAFNVTRITTGLPPGLSYGLQTVRGGTLSSVISQPYLGSTSSTDPLRIQVTAGEVDSFMALVWCDQAGAKARLDVRWYDASGTYLSSVTSVGAYTNFAAASSWEVRTNLGVTVPPSAAYAVIVPLFVTISGATCPAGALAAVTGAMLASGTTVGPYRDGTFQSLGWTWTGAAHASSSKKVFLAPGEFSTPTDTVTTAAAIAKQAVSVFGPVVPEVLPFSTTIPVTVLRQAKSYVAAIDLDAMHPRSAGPKLFVSKATGNNANDGLSWDTAKRDPANAASAGGTYTPAEIVIDDGIYLRSESISAFGRGDLKITARNPGKAILTQHDVGTSWVQHAGSVYKLVMSTTGNVLDISSGAPKMASGLPVPLTLKTSINEVTAAAHSIYYDAASTTVYVRTFDGRAPDANILVSRLTYHLNSATIALGVPHAIFADGIEFWGGQYARLQAQMVGAQFLHRNCAWRFASGNGIGFQGFKVAGVGSTCTHNGIDGFNYHSVTLSNGTVVQCEFLEVSCVGRLNGQDPTQTSCNGTTSHDGSKGIRVNGVHEFNPGPQVADVNNAVTANYGVESGDCVGYPATTGPDFDFAGPADGTTGMMYLFGCKSRSSRALRGSEAVRVVNFDHVGAIANQQGSATDGQGNPVTVKAYA